MQDAVVVCTPDESLRDSDSYSLLMSGNFFRQRVSRKSRLNKKSTPA